MKLKPPLMHLNCILAINKNLPPEEKIEMNDLLAEEDLASKHGNNLVVAIPGVT